MPGNGTSRTLYHVDNSGSEVDIELLAAEEIQAEEAIDAYAWRQSVSNYWKAMARLAQGH